MDFNSNKASLIENLKRANEAKNINTLLKKHKWAIIHPQLQGAFLKHFDDLHKSNLLTEKSIFEVFAEIFLNFQITSYYIEANVKSCKSLSPFCPLIDQSVILCIQRDYMGAIHTLLPVIEGVTTNYLKAKNLKVNKKEPFYKTFFDDIRKSYKETLKYHYTHGIRKVYTYTQEQIDESITLHLDFFNIWVEIIMDYFDNGLFVKAHKKSKDSVNRHAIFHGLCLDVQYDFQNFLKIFHCIYYLSWALSYAGERKVLPDLDVKEALYKWKAYEKLRLLSDFSMSIKTTIYEKYTDFDKKEFQLDFLRKSRYIKPFAQDIEHQMKNVDKEFKKMEKEINI